MNAPLLYPQIFLFPSVSSIQAIYTSQPALVSLASSIPIAQVHILLDIYSRPTPVVALFDTEAVATIIHPKILLEEF